MWRMMNRLNKMAKWVCAVLLVVLVGTITWQRREVIVDFVCGPPFVEQGGYVWVKTPKAK